MNGIEFDEVLNLEHKFYQEGYEEGRNENLRKNLLEGKQYGLQVGFQRFQLLGTIYGVCTILEEKIDDNALQKNIKTIKSLIEDIKLDNKQQNVTVYERSIFKIRNKFRLVLMIMQKHLNKEFPTNERITLEKIETLSKEISGELNGYVENDVDDSSNIIVQDQSTNW